MNINDTVSNPTMENLRLLLSGIKVSKLIIVYDYPSLHVQIVSGLSVAWFRVDEKGVYGDARKIGLPALTKIGSPLKPQILVVHDL